MIVSTTNSAPVPDNSPLVTFLSDGDIAVYPQGLGSGNGPLLIGSFEEFQTLVNSMQAALVAANRPERFW